MNHWKISKSRMKKEKFKDMVRDELQKLLQEHGMTEAYTLELLEETKNRPKFIVKEIINDNKNKK